MVCVMSKRLRWFAVPMVSRVCLPFFYDFHGLSTFYAVSMVSMPAPFPWFWLMPLFCRGFQVLSLLFDGAGLSFLTLSGIFFWVIHTFAWDVAVMSVLAQTYLSKQRRYWTQHSLLDSNRNIFLLCSLSCGDSIYDTETEVHNPNLESTLVCWYCTASCHTSILDRTWSLLSHVAGIYIYICT